MERKISWSRVELWRQCPFKFKCRYIDEIPEPPDYRPTNALLLGSTLDLGIQEGYESARAYYRSQLPRLCTEGETELIKIRHWLPQLRAKFNKGEFQVEIRQGDFIGYADYVEDGKLLVDFKYSNNTEYYRESGQIHVYASMMDPRPEYLAYVCIPKLRTEQPKPKNLADVENRVTIEEYRKGILKELSLMEIEIIWVDYDQTKVDAFWRDAELMLNDTEFEARKNNYCRWCDYKGICPLKRKPRKRVKVKS